MAPATIFDNASSFDEFAPDLDGVALIPAAAMLAVPAQNAVAGLLMMGKQGATCADVVKRGHSLPLLCSHRISELDAAQV